MKFLVYPLAGLLTTFLLANCSVKEDLDTMLDTTKEVGDTSKEMNETTKQLNETSQEMNETTKEMNETTKSVEEKTTALHARTLDLFEGSIEGFGEQIMNERFEQLKAAKTTAEKTSHAVIIFAAMDFQHWKGDFDHDLETREYFIEKNVEYFFNNLKRFPTDGNPMGPKLFRPQQFDNWKSVGAMAVAMSKVHPGQVRLAQALGFEPLSMYDIISRSLKAQAAFERGEEVPHYVRVVLENHTTAKYLLQLRHNFFKGTILAAISDYEEGRKDGLFNKFWYGKLARKMEIETKKFGLAEYDKWSVDWLWKIAVTQQDLRDIGERVQSVDLITNAFNKVVFVENGKTIDMTDYNKQEIDLLDPSHQGLDGKTNFFTRFIRLQD